LIVVDSSVWIDFLNGSQSQHALELQRLINGEHRLLLTDHVLTEVLQGYSRKSEADEIAEFLLAFGFLGLEGPTDYLAAADLYRHARSVGITVRNIADVLIAVPCIRNDAWLLHNDRDFDNLATVTDLKIWQPAG
jgi:predicted nucleic acid-binding protein